MEATIPAEVKQALAAAYGKAQDSRTKAHSEAKRLQLKAAIAPITEEDYQSLITRMLAAIQDAWAFIDATARYAETQVSVDE